MQLSALPSKSIPLRGSVQGCTVKLLSRLTQFDSPDETAAMLEPHWNIKLCCGH